jgi:histidyl-tRNA synthetase
MFAKNAKISGVGYGMGDVTLENFLVTHGLVPDLYAKEIRVLVARFDDVPYESYISTVASLRDAGIPASLYLGSKKFGKQIDYAVKGHYSHVLIMGGSELEAGIAKIKDLNTREEITVAIADIPSALK